MHHLEIERKFLLTQMPLLPNGAEVWRIEQGYLADHNGRLRRTTLHNGTVICTYTTKTGHGVVRQECERVIDERDFENRWPQTAGWRLRKIRHRVQTGELVWEIDQFVDFELVLAEIELPAADTPVVFPDWLGTHVVREVTDEPAYTNVSIAKKLNYLS